MALQLNAILTAIAGLSITGVTVLDTDALVENAELSGPVLMPRGDLVSGWTFGRKSFGTGSTAFGVIGYQINYSFLYAPVGSNLSLSSIYPTMVSLFENIMDALIDNDTLGSVEDTFPASVTFGKIPDPAGHFYYGCNFSITVTEYDNA